MNRRERSVCSRQQCVLVIDFCIRDKLLVVPHLSIDSGSSYCQCVDWSLTFALFSFNPRIALKVNAQEPPISTI
jgi:hypothetical protein